MADQTTAAAPVVPTQTVKPSTPVTPNSAPAPDPVAEAKAILAKAEAANQAAEKRARVYAAEQRKFADEKKGIGAKLSEYEQLKKSQAQAKLNKAAYLKSLYGDDWYDQIVQEKLNGGSPTADTVALEVERVREEFAKKFEDHKAELTKAQQAEQQARVQADLRNFNNQAVEFAASSAKDYPIFEELGDANRIGAALVQRIRAEHDRTIQRDEMGAVTRPGKVLSWKEAADVLEADMIRIAERAAAHDKYRPKLTEKMKPATVAPVVNGGPQLRRTDSERRTLSNDLTASTSGRAPSKSDDERRERALAAYEAARGKATAQ